MNSNIGWTAAFGFMKDMRGMLYGDSNRSNGNWYTAKEIANTIDISVQEATDFMTAAVNYGMSYLENGKYVI